MKGLAALALAQLHHGVGGGLGQVRAHGQGKYRQGKATEQQQLGPLVQGKWPARTQQIGGPSDAPQIQKPPGTGPELHPSAATNQQVNKAGQQDQRHSQLQAAPTTPEE